MLRRRQRLLCRASVECTSHTQTSPANHNLKILLGDRENLHLTDHRGAAMSMSLERRLAALAASCHSHLASTPIVRMLGYVRRMSLGPWRILKSYPSG